MCCAFRNFTYFSKKISEKFTQMFRRWLVLGWLRNSPNNSCTIRVYFHTPKIEWFLHIGMKNKNNNYVTVITKSIQNNILVRRTRPTKNRSDGTNTFVIIQILYFSRRNDRESFARSGRFNGRLVCKCWRASTPHELPHTGVQINCIFNFCFLLLLLQYILHCT